MSENKHNPYMWHTVPVGHWFIDGADCDEICEKRECETYPGTGACEDCSGFLGKVDLKAGHMSPWILCHEHNATLARAEKAERGLDEARACVADAVRVTTETLPDMDARAEAAEARVKELEGALQNLRDAGYFDEDNHPAVAMALSVLEA